MVVYVTVPASLKVLREVKLSKLSKIAQLASKGKLYFNYS